MRISSLRMPIAAALAALLLTAGAALAAAQPGAEKARPGLGERGVLVVAVVPDSPAAKAGFARGDIILSAGGKDVNSPEDLISTVRGKKAGEMLPVTISHGDAVKSLTVTLAEQNGRTLLGVVPFGPGREEGREGGREGSPMMGRQGFRDGGPWMHGGRGMFGGGAFRGGAWVQTVVPGGPAEKAGVKAGDVILAVDGTRVGPEEDLGGLIGAHKVGDSVTLSVGSRGTEPRDVKVTLEESTARKGSPYLGVEYAAAPGGFDRDDRDFPGVRSGVVVRQVADASPAARAGVKVRDVIIAVEGVPVSSPRAVAGAVSARKPGDGMSLTLSRQGEEKETTLTVTLGEDPKKPGQAFLGVGMGRIVSWEGPEDMMAGPGSRGPRVPGARAPGPRAPGI